MGGPSTGKEYILGHAQPWPSEPRITVRAPPPAPRAALGKEKLIKEQFAHGNAR